MEAREMPAQVNVSSIDQIDDLLEFKNKQYNLKRILIFQIEQNYFWPNYKGEEQSVIREHLRGGAGG